MILKNLLTESQYKHIKGELDVEVTGIAYDSRKVVRGTLYVCIEGAKQDGHNFIMDAIKRGATGIIVQNSIDTINIPSSVTVIKVKNSKKTLSQVSNLFYDKPSEKVNIIGITGTNGKTSITYLLSEILKSIHRTVGTIGTIGVQVNNKDLTIEKTTPTTPDSLELQMILKEMLDKRVSEVVMEVTSIALDQHRVNDCNIDMGIFSNLTEDHLDYHGNMEEYKKAKEKLFEICPQGIINVDDPTGREFADKYKQHNNKEILTYGIQEEADIRAENLILNPFGSKFDLCVNKERYSFNIKLPGKFNVYNVLAAVAAALKLGVNIEDIIRAFTHIGGAKGRFESVNTSNGATIVVDYAHTPDALENVLQTAKEFKAKRIITVFGCGGDRDRTKRPIMGEISTRYSDLSILTSDNPRTEDPNNIIKEIESGISTPNYKIVIDREEAIKTAINNANKEDLIIIAGKGHETYQIIADKTIHFDDMEIVKKYIKKEA